MSQAMRWQVRRSIATRWALAVLCLAAFWPVLGNDFLSFDDQQYVTGNPWVKRGLSLEGAVWAATSFAAANWHPLTWLTHMVDVSIYGLDPRGHHLTSLVLHIAAAVLLYLALEGVTGSWWPSAMAAAFWAVHPLRVESVAWVAQRKDVLSALFFMLTVLMYWQYLRRPRRSRYLAMVVAFVLGLLSKPMLVSVPLVLLLLDYWPFNRLRATRGCTVGECSGRKAFLRSTPFLEKVPLFLLAALSALVTVIAQFRGGALRSIELYPVWLRIENAIVSYAAYLGKLVWPYALAATYSYPRNGLAPWKVAVSTALLAAIAATVVRSSRRHPYIATGMLWYMVMLLPVIGLVQVGRQAMADRYSYLPSIGALILVFWWLFSALALRGRTVLAAMMLPALLATSMNQAQYWESDRTLFGHAIAVTEDNWLAQRHLAIVLDDEGRRGEAAKHYRQVLERGPDFAEAHSGMETMLPPDSSMLKDPAKRHASLAADLAARGRMAEAVAEYRRALDYHPRLVPARFNLANLLSRQGQLAEAMGEYQEVLRINPDYALAHNNLASTLVRQGKFAEAESHYRRAVVLLPQRVEIRVDLGHVLRALGREREAVEQYREALLLDPGNVAAIKALRDTPPERQDPDNRALGTPSRPVSRPDSHAH